jgi:hypothetical protein
MGASSVTGVSGPGDSEGKYKPGNNCGCSCGDPDEEEPKERVKLGCYSRAVSPGPKVYRARGGSQKIRVC